MAEGFESSDERQSVKIEIEQLSNEDISAYISDHERDINRLIRDYAELTKAIMNIQSGIATLQKSYDYLKLRLPGEDNIGAVRSKEVNERVSDDANEILNQLA